MTIIATNGAGTSEPSNEVSVRTNEAGTYIHTVFWLYIYFHIYAIAPGIVKIIEVVSISDTTSLITWNPPIQPNGVITGYEVTHAVYEDTTNRIPVSVSRNTNSLNITNLCKLQVLHSKNRWVEITMKGYFNSKMHVLK